jgi:hypothetical protein
MTAMLSICLETPAQMRTPHRGGSSSQPVSPSQPASVSIDSGSKIQTIPTGITSITIINAEVNGGSGSSTLNSSLQQVTTPTRAAAITDTTATSGGINANVRNSVGVVNTPSFTQGSGQSTAQVNGGTTGSAVTNTLGTSSYSPNSATGLAIGSVRGRR